MTWDLMIIFILAFGICCIIVRGWMMKQECQNNLKELKDEGIRSARNGNK